MLVTGHPQFETQDDMGIGDGVSAIPEWQLDSNSSFNASSALNSIELDFEVENVIVRLRNVFERVPNIPLPPTRFHDLTCFVIHRLLLTAPKTDNDQSSPTTECFRYAIILYMFIIQGPTYYSHAVIFNNMLARLVEHLQQISTRIHVSELVQVWLLTVGMTASAGTDSYLWFVQRSRAVADTLQITHWSEVLISIQNVLWLETARSESHFRPHWDDIFNAQDQTGPPRLLFSVSSSTIREELL